MTASDVLVERLMEWGVEVIFGLPGDGINGIMEALRTRQEKVRFRGQTTAAPIWAVPAKVKNGGGEIIPFFHSRGKARNGIPSVRNVSYLKRDLMQGHVCYRPIVRED